MSFDSVRHRRTPLGMTLHILRWLPEMGMVLFWEFGLKRFCREMGGGGGGDCPDLGIEDLGGAWLS